MEKASEGVWHDELKLGNTIYYCFCRDAAAQLLGFEGL